jgi:hypothetical protein
LISEWWELGAPKVPDGEFEKDVSFEHALTGQYISQLRDQQKGGITPTDVCTTAFCAASQCGQNRHNSSSMTKILDAMHRAKTDLQKTGDCERPTEYHHIWWNAWLYSGSDNLWAGLIKALNDAVDERFGASFTHARYKAMLIYVAFEGLVVVLLLCVCVHLYTEKFGNEWGDLYDIQESASSMYATALGIVTTISAALMTVHSIQKVVTTPVSNSAQLVRDAASGAIRKRLGFMTTIKDELDTLGTLLREPNKNVSSFIDYLPLPKWTIPHAKKLWHCAPGMKPPIYAPCRLAIVIDDLDRCPPDKAVEVLQSLVLLTEGTPFVIFLAIDPRIVVTAIETTNAKFFGDAGVNGYEYLGKIVQIPFAIPPLADNEVANLCHGYLTPPRVLTKEEVAREKEEEDTKRMTASEIAAISEDDVANYSDLKVWWLLQYHGSQLHWPHFVNLRRLNLANNKLQGGHSTACQIGLKTDMIDLNSNDPHIISIDPDLFMSPFSRRFTA